MKRWVGVGLALLLGGAVVVALVLGGGGDEGGGGTKDLATVRGVIGSEKKPFFDDPQVKAAFAKHGLRVEVDAAGSRQIATSVDLGKYDFAFPSSVPAAEKIKQDRKASRTFSPFYSPMAIATFEPIVDVLTKAGVVSDSGSGYQVLDVQKYLDLVAKGTRWDALPGNTAYPARKRVLLTTTDVRTSNSAAMYLAITSYVANGDDVVNSSAQTAKVAQTISPLFLDQGYSESSSEAPFEDYLAMGVGKTPMVVIYEAQYASHLFAGDGAIRPDMRLLYPSPTVLSKHTLVPFNDQAAEVGRLLQEDQELARLETRYGFRTADPKVFADLVASSKAAIPASLVDVVEPPTYDHLERLISTIEQRYLAGGKPSS
ncbi:hypothetical protein [Planotetraspora kaengkrachanensis]|uniref:Extracellular solute-binding protein n=1 Tax=Planotetraspora kaengkrachanensis TaxID=575193 RepID=A0A8J3VBZ3_9ACTN|nr:hypothetical protein [Planotetraspora kaengkrachanensis]GIG84014.1 hypothetical protein Pka01_71410 [Planotetraspora kaengkrachanensis]